MMREGRRKKEEGVGKEGNSVTCENNFRNLRNLFLEWKRIMIDINKLSSINSSPLLLGDS